MKAKIEGIEQLINEASTEILKKQDVPHDFTTVKKAVLLCELKLEIIALKKMLLDCDTFENQFKARCLARDTDKECGISFRVMPQSLTNRLYWQIAQLVFEPNTMQDMLAILMPGITYQLLPDIHYSSHLGPQQDIQVMKAEVNLVCVNNLKALDEKPTLELFTQYILSNAILLDGNHIAQFSLNHHANLYHVLNEQHHELANQLYSHNSTLHTLSQDIQILNKGIIPKVAIEQLIQALVAGGEKITGKYYASDAAIQAVGSFSQFFYALPIETQAELRALKADDKSFGSIIDEEIAKGKCVESTSSYLMNLLKQNANQKVLTLSSTIDLKQLKDKYGPKHSLNMHKEDISIPYFPIHLINEAIEHLSPTTPEDLVSLIISFPPSFYDTLWQHMHVDNPSKVLKNIANLINMGFFENAQKQALARALTKKFPIKNTLFYAVVANCLDFFQTVLDGYPKDEWLSVFSEADELGHNVLHYAVFSPELIERVLTLLPQKEYLQKLLIANKRGYSALDYAIMYPNSLHVFLPLLSREELILEIERNNYNLLHRAAKNAEYLELLLTLYPEKDQNTIVQKRDNEGKTLLHHAASSLDSIRVIFRRYSEEELLEAVQDQDYKGKTSLHYASESPQALALLLSIYPIEERFAAVEAQSMLTYGISAESVRTILSLLHEGDRGKILTAKNGHVEMYRNRTRENFLSKVSSRIEILTILQELIPAQYWLAALQEGSENEENALYTSSAKCLLSILKFLPEQVLIAAVQTKGKEGKTMLHRNADNLELCCNILLCVPKAYRLAIIQIKDDSDATLAYYLKDSFEGLKMLLDLLPDDDKLPTLQTLCHYDSLLHLPIGGDKYKWINIDKVLLLDSIKKKLSLLPESYHLQALQTVDKQGNSLFYYFGNDLILLEGLLTFLPAPKRLHLLQKKYNGKSILGDSSDKPDLFKMVLSVLPKQDFYSALNSVVLDGGLRVFYDVARNPVCLKILLGQVPEDVIKKAIKIQGHQGTTLFHHIASQPESLQLLLPYYTKDELSEAFQVKDPKGCMPLHYAIEDVKSFEIMFNYFSEEKQRELMEVADNDGNTMPFYIHSVESVKAFFTRYPETQRLGLTQLTNGKGECMLSDKRDIDFIGAIVSCLPAEDRLTVLQTKGKKGKTLLERIVKNSDFPDELLAQAPEDTNLALYCKAMKVICRFNQKNNQNGNAFFNVTTNFELSGFVMTSSEMVKKNLTDLLLENHNNPTPLQMKLVKKLGEFIEVTQDNYDAKLDELLMGALLQDCKDVSCSRIM